jgi:DNA polymerase V
MYAIVDCNSFYCTCERLFRPDLWHKPVVVLSNNDGCIISRTDEARKAGVAMAVPYYQCRELIEKNDVAVFSSNYYLYGELSRRVMDTLAFMVNDSSCNRVEVYSVDEAFINLDHIPLSSIAAFAGCLKTTVEMWTGIRVSVGVAPTKVLSKMANRLAKKNKEKTGGVLVLDTEEKIKEALETTDVGDIWGVGGRYGKKLRESFGIANAYQLSHVPLEWARKELGGVVGVRLVKELCGDPCIDMKDPLEKKKMIATTRMFGKPVYTLQPLKEAVATFVSRAAEKLRRQCSAAGTIDVFVVTNGSGHDKYAYDPKSDHRYYILPMATAQTDKLIAYAMPLIEKLFRPGMKYLKAGVILGGLVPEASVQGNLFSGSEPSPQKGLMEVLDNLNFSMRGDVVRFGATGLTRNWKMRQELRSQRFTTRWEELFVVK